MTTVDENELMDPVESVGLALELVTLLDIKIREGASPEDTDRAIMDHALNTAGPSTGALLSLILSQTALLHPMMEVAANGDPMQMVSALANDLGTLGER